MYYVYILWSEKHDKYYKGFTTNPLERLRAHNLGESRYTKHFTPWKIIHLELFDEKSLALKREKA